MSIRTAIVGPTGYAGLSLIELLLNHPGATLTHLASRRDPAPHIAEVFPRLVGRLPDSVGLCQPIAPETIAAHADAAFLALPSGVAMELAPELLEAGVTVIDLSADYRFHDPKLYERANGKPHGDPDRLSEAVYGLPERHRRQIPKARLVGNPGCYPTTAALPLAPLLERGLIDAQSVIVNAASGVTGAGRKPAQHLHFPEQNEAFTAYGTIGGHRHQAEIEQTLRDAAGGPAPVLFVPHLLPVDRGILATIYADPAAGVTESDLFDALEQAYADEPFVRVRSELPQIKDVRATNFCDITARLVEDEQHPRRAVLFSSTDNIVKGAAGQAVQNLNLLFGQEETAGLL